MGKIERPSRAIQFLFGKIEDTAQAAKAIGKAANAFLFLCGLLVLSMCLNVVQNGISDIVAFAGSLIPLILLAVPAITLKKRQSSLSAKTLAVISALFLALSLYLSLGWLFAADTKGIMAGVLILGFWAFYLRISVRACYAIKQLRTSPSEAL